VIYDDMMLCDCRDRGRVTSATVVVVPRQLHNIHCTWQLQVCCQWFGHYWDVKIGLCLIQCRFCFWLFLNIVKKNCLSTVLTHLITMLYTEMPAWLCL